jgi:hypothetical protein
VLLTDTLGKNVTDVVLTDYFCGAILKISSLTGECLMAHKPKSSSVHPERSMLAKPQKSFF